MPPRRPAAPDPGALDAVARRYVVLGLGLGRHDANYVDAYYGPDSLRTKAEAESLTVAQVRVSAESLIAILGDSVPAYADSMVRLRHRYLRVQLGAMAARARMLAGERLTFDAGGQGAVRRRAAALPGRALRLAARAARQPASRAGPLADRYQRFRDRFNIPAAKVDTVFKAAIAACRARTLAHMALPPGERFDLEYVKGTPWNAYNWYKGSYHSLIQVNLDFPVALDRAIDLACHEGYPGHHVYNALLEQALVHGRGWVEISMYPLFSPQSLIAEGSANYGIDMAFPSPSGRRSSGTRCFRWRGWTARSPSGTPRSGRSWSGSTTRATRWLAGISTGDSTRRGRGRPCALLAELARGFGQDRALHRHVPELRHQLQSREGSRGRLGRADRRGVGGRALGRVSRAALRAPSAEGLAVGPLRRVLRTR